MRNITLLGQQPGPACSYLQKDLKRETVPFGTPCSTPHYPSSRILSLFQTRHRQSREALELQDILAQEARLGNIRQRQVEAEEAAAKKLKAENREAETRQDF